MKNRQDVIEWLWRIELNYPVHEWEINHVRIWPLLRKELFLRLVASIDKVKNPSPNPYERPGFLSRTLEIVKSSIVVLQFRLRRNQHKSAIFCGAGHFRSTMNGAQYNKFFDPMMDHLEQNGRSSLMVEFSARSRGSNYYRPDRIFFLNDFLPFFRLASKMRRRKMVSHLPRFEDFSMELSSIQILKPCINRFSKASLERNLIGLKPFEMAFSLILKVCKPEFAFGLSYYNKEILGLNLAAKVRDTITVDMQHGSQGPLHFAYTDWKRLPLNGYELLPDYFWCWDKDSAQTLLSWVKRSEHEVIIGGNPWIQLVNRLSSDFIFPNSMILYTMQPMGALLDQYIIEAIKLTSKRYSWWLRLHPRQIHQMGELQHLLEIEKIENVNFSEASNLPLPSLLQSCILHISKFSGSIEESVIMGTPTLILHQIGVQTFSHYLEVGFASACLSNDARELVESIDSIVNQKVIRQSSLIDFRPHLDNLFKKDAISS